MRAPGEAVLWDKKKTTQRITEEHGYVRYEGKNNNPQRHPRESRQADDRERPHPDAGEAHGGQSSKGRGLTVSEEFVWSLNKLSFYKGCKVSVLA